MPSTVPEDEREDWVVSQLDEGKLIIPDSEWEPCDESDPHSADYEEASQLDG